MDTLLAGWDEKAVTDTCSSNAVFFSLPHVTLSGGGFFVTPPNLPTLPAGLLHLGVELAPYAADGRHSNRSGRG